MFSPPAALRRLHPVAESNSVALSTRSPPTPPLAGEVWQALHWFSLNAGPRPSAGPNTWLNNSAPARNRASSGGPRPGSGVPGSPVPAGRPLQWAAPSAARSNSAARGGGAGLLRDPAEKPRRIEIGGQPNLDDLARLRAEHVGHVAPTADHEQQLDHERPRAPGNGDPGLTQVPAHRPQGIARPARVHGVQARVVVVVVDDLHEHTVGRLGGRGVPDVDRPAVGAGCREHDYRSAAEP